VCSSDLTEQIAWKQQNPDAWKNLS